MYSWITPGICMTMRNTSYDRTIVYWKLDKVYPCLSIFRNALFLHLVRHKAHLKLNSGFGTFFSYAKLYLQVQLLNHVLIEGAAVVLRSEVSHGPCLVRRYPTEIITNPAVRCVHRNNLSRNYPSQFSVPHTRPSAQSLSELQLPPPRAQRCCGLQQLPRSIPGRSQQYLSYPIAKKSCGIFAYVAFDKPCLGLCRFLAACSRCGCSPPHCRDSP